MRCAVRNQFLLVFGVYTLERHKLSLDVADLAQVCLFPTNYVYFSGGVGGDTKGWMSRIVISKLAPTGSLYVDGDSVFFQPLHPRTASLPMGPWQRRAALRRD